MADDKKTAWETYKETRNLGEDASDEVVIKAALSEIDNLHKISNSKDQLLESMTSRLEALESKFEQEKGGNEKVKAVSSNSNEQVSAPDPQSIAAMFEAQQSLKERINILEKEKEDMILRQKEDKINAIIDDAVVQGKIQDIDRKNWLIVAHDNFDNFVSLIKSQEPIVSLTRSQSSNGMRKPVDHGNISYNQLEISERTGVSAEQIEAEIKRQHNLGMRRGGLI